jgi:hypothetical protein
VFENRVLRRIFGPKRDEVTGGWRKLHNEGGEMGRACSTNGEKRNVYTILVENPKRKRPLGRSRCRWVDNVKMDLRRIGCVGMDWIDLVQDSDQWWAFVNTVMNLPFHKVLGNS